MDVTIGAALLGLGGTLIGAYVGARFAYKGAIDAVTKQIEYQNKQSEREMIQQVHVAIGIIARFLWKEIEYNCEKLDGTNCYISKNIFSNDTPKQYGISNILLKFDEFEKVKFELLKYKSKTVKDIFDIYDKFYLLSIHRDIKELTIEEYNWVKTIFNDKEELRKEIDKDFKVSQYKSS